MLTMNGYSFEVDSIPPAILTNSGTLFFKPQVIGSLLEMGK